MENDETILPQMIRQQATIAQIAKLAGVGTATVDRVLNNRQHVGEATRQRVLQAREAIETGALQSSRRQPWRIKVFLPDEAGPSTVSLASYFQEVGHRGNVSVECVFTKKMEPATLARKLHACAGQGIDAVAFQALEDQRVRDAVSALAKLNIPSAALLSSIESASTVAYIGLDNRAAGRTAGYLMGRLARRSGPVALVSGGQLYRGHEEREMGFRAALRRDFPQISNTVVCSGHDSREDNYRAVLDVLEAHPDLVGIYNVGGGIKGVGRALTDAGADGEVLFFGHNLTSTTQSYLLEGTMDIVLHINMRMVAERTVEALTAHLEQRPFAPRVLPVGIVTRENVHGVDQA